MKTLNDIVEYDPDTGMFDIKHGVGGRKRGVTPGGKGPNGYLRLKVNGKSYLAHRLAFLIMTGREPKIVDHKNGDRTDNRWSNLRETGHNGSSQNMVKKVSSAGFVGLKLTRTGKYQVRMCVNSRHLHFGTFTDFELACLVSEEARDKWHKQFSVLNRGSD